MKALKMFGLGLLGLILLLAIIGFFLPGKSKLERSIVIKASPEVIFEQINQLKNWEGWSPWKAMDPQSVMNYSEPSAGKDAYYTWNGPETGKGKLTITSSTPYTEILTDVEFDGMGVSKSWFVLAPDAGGVKLTWGFESELGMNPMMRWGGLFMKGMLGDQYDQGLAKIKEIAEKMPAVTTTWKGKIESVKEEALPVVHYMAMHDTASVPTIGMKLGMAYAEIGKVMSMQKLMPSGAPFGIYYSESNTNFDFDAAIPCEKPGKSEGKVKAGTRAAGNAVVVSFLGDYTQTPLAHETADKYIREHKKEVIGAPWEEYVTDPEMEKDTAKWLTKVYYPVK